ncbi:DUF2399 domain-containing protein [Actinomadura sp. NBRC 104425]|uniref:DUF2399 domain-containing protein n=1 Tax=Actinomadura sp. NBRC 104425 TaxID=3032204 RepID=UPI0033302266
MRERVGGWRAWRYDRGAYLAAASGGSLSGRAVATPWDPGLGAAMAELGVRVEEELVLSDLLDDLRGRG